MYSTCRENQEWTIPKYTQEDKFENENKDRQTP